MDWEAVWQQVRRAALNADAVAARHPDDLAVCALRAELQQLEAWVAAAYGAHRERARDQVALPQRQNDARVHRFEETTHASTHPRRPVKAVAPGVLDGSEDWDCLIR
ncbi:hypothetical protein [Hydrogenophilus thiooxidans]|uniref:hypothetical protein n=1 Tax=Hydrogenophilus thiooxidans TaxID=2820326 RepID=UPI001C218D65|nr:hypothetical protein [Hydrogenophilus thiooxidans]